MNLRWKTLKSVSSFKWSDGGVTKLYIGTLSFSVYNKPNQVIKYLNKSSTQKRSVFHAIPKGVLQRLHNLTSFDVTNFHATADELYPLHYSGLVKAGLVKKGCFPVLSVVTTSTTNKTVLSMLSSENGSFVENWDGVPDTTDSRTFYFCIS